MLHGAAWASAANFFESAGRGGVIASRFLQDLVARKAAYPKLHHAETASKALKRAALELWPELGARLVRIAWETHCLATGMATREPRYTLVLDVDVPEHVQSPCCEAGVPADVASSRLGVGFDQSGYLVPYGCPRDIER